MESLTRLNKRACENKHRLSIALDLISHVTKLHCEFYVRMKTITASAVSIRMDSKYYYTVNCKSQYNL